LHGGQQSIFRWDTHILSNNLYGVDLNRESVEITKLSLWLKTARRNEKLTYLERNIKVGNSLIDDKTVAGDLAFVWHEEFPQVFEQPNDGQSRNRKIANTESGFDVVIGNPPYGADIDKFVSIYETLYPETSQGFKDIYKYFFDRSVGLINNGGILGFITPNTFFRQPRYADLRRFLLRYKIEQLIDLGEGVFDVVVPTAITILSKKEKGEVLFADLSKSKEGDDIKKQLHFTKIDQSVFEHTPNNIFVESFRAKRNNEYLLDEVLEMKDAGINYQRVNVGLHDKGNSDLSKRLLYEGKKEKANDIEYHKGVDINSFFIVEKTNRFVRLNVELNENERVILNKDYFEITPKLVWRQTAPFPIVAIDTKGIWFGRSIQAGIIKTDFTEKITYEYLCVLLNSKYLRYLYECHVKETGRVFPQVKLEKLKSLPIIVTDHQQPFIDLADRMLSYHTDLRDQRKRFLDLVSDNLGVTISEKRFDVFMEFKDFLEELKRQKKTIPLAEQPEWKESFGKCKSEIARLQKDIRLTDAEIDRRVYDLYGLTGEEIETIENNAPT